MKSVRTVVTLLLALFLVVPIAMLPVHADVPSPLAFSMSPSAFALGQTSSTFICMTQQTNPAQPPTTLAFNTGDKASFVFDPAIGTVTSVDSPITVRSSTLAASDFTAALGASNNNKVVLTYTAGASKAFNFGDCVCAKVNFTANASAAAGFVRFSNKFTGTNGTLPSLVVSIVDPSLLPSSGLSSTNFIPGTVAGSIALNRNTGTNPGSSLSFLAGSPASGATDIAGGDLIFGAGAGTGLGGGGNVRIQTAGANDLSGTSDNLLVDREIVVAKAKQLTLSAPGFTSLMSIQLTGTHTAGGRIFYTIRATDGGSQIATESGVIQYLATANSITCTVQTTDKLHLGTVNSGCTPGFFNPGSQPGVSIFDNVSFSSPAPIVVHEVYFRILNDSGSPIRLEP